MKPTIPSCNAIELACAQLWGWRTNIIVPNVSWGAGVHECDLLILSKAGFATEVEIKRSLADLKKDAAKRHGHSSDRIKYLYFAMPESMLKHESVVPERAGIISIEANQYYESGFMAKVCRQPRANPSAKKWTRDERMNLSRLAAMRIWSLTRKLVKKSQTVENQNK